VNDKVLQVPSVSIDSTFDATRPLIADGPPDPVVYDGSTRAIRQRTVNFAAKRFADMMYVSGLDRSTAERHFRWRALGIPGGLMARPDASDGQAELHAAHRAGRISIETNDADRRVTVRWADVEFGAALVGSAIARPATEAFYSARAPRPVSIRRRLRAGRPIRSVPGHPAMLLQRQAHHRRN
jgi:hypothetical protein